MKAEEVRECKVLVGIDEERDGYDSAEEMREYVDGLGVWLA